MQPTPFCNIDCSYCYLPARADRRLMTSEVVTAVFRKVLSSDLMGPGLTVAWHGGEPLVVPRSWYQDAFEWAERYRPKDLALTHSFQTNATLVDRGWIDFFTATGAGVGVSLDGPAALHDSRRRTRKGSGTHAQTERGYHRLQEAGLQPGILAVLTPEALAVPDLLFDYFSGLGVSRLAFNVEEVEAANEHSSMGDPAIENAYRRFLHRFLERMAATPDAFALRELDLALGIIAAGGVPAGLNQETEPMRIISVSVAGDVSTFSPELLGMTHRAHGDFTFGNVLRDEISQMMQRVLDSAMYRDIRAGLGACRRGCSWFAYCGGGSPSNKLYENGSFATSETAYCRLTRQILLEVVLELCEAGHFKAPAWELVR